MPKVFGEIRKTNKWRRIIVHHGNASFRLKSAPYWVAKTLNWRVIRRTALTWHPMTSLYSRISRKICVVYDSRYQKILLECSKAMFWRCLNRSGKTNTNDSRTSKHSEYRYAKKWQTVQWKCQIASGKKYARPEAHRSNLVKLVSQFSIIIQIKFIFILQVLMIFFIYFK